MTDIAPTDADALPPAAEAARLWTAFHAGDADAREQLLAHCYAELRRIARRVLGGEGPQRPLQPTELVNEAALRLLRLERMQFADRRHFLATAARVMRQVLLDEVRRARAGKRGAGVVTRWQEIHDIAVPDVHDARDAPCVDLEALDAALTRLQEVSAERARVVELRYYVGLTLEEIAVETGVSLRTVKRQWQSARAWLLAELAPLLDQGVADAPTGGPAGA